MLYNADMISDESIGSMRVNLDGLLDDGDTHDVWVPLEKVDSREIKLEIEPIKERSQQRQGTSRKECRCTARANRVHRW